MHYAKSDARSYQSTRRSEHVPSVNEGRRPQHTSIGPSGEEGEVGSKGSSPVRPSGHQPGSMQLSNTLPELSEIDMDLSFENYIENESNPMGFKDGGNLNIDEFVTGFGDLPKGDFNEYESINID